MDNYYVYRWIDADTGATIYVGKGHGDRQTSMRNRSEGFLEYVSNHKCKPEIIIDGLDEDTAYNLERFTIAYCREVGEPLLNVANGGRGGITMYGENNPMYGRPWWDENTPQEKIDEWKRKVGRSGADNPMYGISPSERMDEVTYLMWKEAHKKIVGEKNPNYGNRKLSAFYAEHKDVALEKQSRPGSRNGRCKRVTVVFPDGSTKTYDYIRECVKDLFDGCNVDCVANNISKHMRDGTPYKGYIFM